MSVLHSIAVATDATSSWHAVGSSKRHAVRALARLPLDFLNCRPSQRRGRNPPPGVAPDQPASEAVTQGARRGDPAGEADIADNVLYTGNKAAAAILAACHAVEVPAGEG